MAASAWTSRRCATTRAVNQTQHLANSMQVFKDLVAVARSIKPDEVEAFRAERDYEGLELFILRKLMGR